MTYSNPRLKHVKNIQLTIQTLLWDIERKDMDIEVTKQYIKDILDQCSLLLETKKDSVKEDVKFLKDNGFKSLSKALVKLDKETKKAKKRKKKTYYYKITGIHEDGSLSNTPKTGSFKVTKSDQKEECKHESGINNAVCWKCGIYLHSLDNQAPIKGGDSCKRVKSILPDPKEESKGCCGKCMVLGVRDYKIAGVWNHMELPTGVCKDGNCKCHSTPTPSRSETEVRVQLKNLLASFKDRDFDVDHCVAMLLNYYFITNR